MAIWSRRSVQARAGAAVAPAIVPIAVGVALALVPLGGAARAASPARLLQVEALTCGRSVVLPGDPWRALLAKCGAPTRRLLGGRAGQLRAAPGRTRRGRAPAPSKREIWVYDRGPRALTRFVHLERGRVLRIDVGGYGR